MSHRALTATRAAGPRRSRGTSRGGRAEHSAATRRCGRRSGSKCPAAAQATSLCRPPGRDRTTPDGSRRRIRPDTKPVPSRRRDTCDGRDRLRIGRPDSASAARSTRSPVPIRLRCPPSGRRGPCRRSRRWAEALAPPSCSRRCRRPAACRWALRRRRRPTRPPRSRRSWSEAREVVSCSGRCRRRSRRSSHGGPKGKDRCRT